jgi:hypothetical protein
LNPDSRIGRGWSCGSDCGNTSIGHDLFLLIQQDGFRIHQRDSPLLRQAGSRQGQLRKTCETKEGLVWSLFASLFLWVSATDFKTPPSFVHSFTAPVLVFFQTSQVLSSTSPVVGSAEAE